jgi:tripartite-type tricarboxylate transporter receptor subunit TctC
MKVLMIVVALVAMLAGAAQAQVYPARPITMIVPYSAGGPTDTLGRILAEHMRGSLGQTVVIENVTGAGGTIGVGRVARAAADGYTLLIGQTSTNGFNGAAYQLPYDLVKDLTPVALLTIAPVWIIGKAALPANNVKELVAWLKANPDKATMGAVGWGGVSHLCGVTFQSHTGTRLGFVPYRGAAPANQDLVAGHLDLLCPEASNSLPLVKGGKVKAFAVLSPHRWAPAPDVPTMDEAGLPGLHIPFWHGLFVAAGTPKEIVGRLNAAAIAAVNDPAIRRRLVDMGQEIPPPEQQTVEAFAAFQRAEIEKWWPIIRAANIKGE